MDGRNHEEYLQEMVVYTGEPETLGRMEYGSTRFAGLCSCAGKIRVDFGPKPPIWRGRNNSESENEVAIKTSHSTKIGRKTTDLARECLLIHLNE